MTAVACSSGALDATNALYKTVSIFMEPPKLREDLAHTGEARMGGNSEATAVLPSTEVDRSCYWRHCDLRSGDMHCGYCGVNRAVQGRNR